MRYFFAILISFLLFSCGENNTTENSSTNGGGNKSVSCKSNPCKNGGVCKEEKESVSCDCTNTNFTGDTCETPKTDKCKDVNCGDHGTCNNDTGKCDCKDNYTGDNCENAPTDKCKDVNCGDHGTCNNTTGKCDCKDNYTGDKCENAPSDPCKDETCSNHGECSNNNGQAKCTCNEGYDGAHCQDCAAGYHKEEQICIKDSNGVVFTYYEYLRPATLNLNVNVESEEIYGQVYAEGVTDGEHTEDARIKAKLCYKSEGSNNSETCVNAVYDINKAGEYNNNHQYKAKLTFSSAGVYDYYFKFSGNSGASYDYTSNIGKATITEVVSSCADDIEEITVGETKTFGSTYSLENTYHPQKNATCNIYGSNGKEKVYKVNLEAGRKIKITASNNAVTDDISVYILDTCESDYTCLKGTDQFNEFDEYEFEETFEYTVPETKTYFVVVDTINNAIFSGGSLKIEYLEDPNPCPDQVQAHDGTCVSLSSCDNIDSIEELTIGQEFINYDGTAGGGENYELPHNTCNTQQTRGEDFIYKVNLEAGKKIKVTVEEEYSSGGEPAIYILNTCKTEQNAYSCIAGSDVSEELIETLEYNVTMTGTYFIVVDSFSDASPLNQYSILLEYIN